MRVVASSPFVRGLSRAIVLALAMAVAGAGGARSQVPAPAAVRSGLAALVADRGVPGATLLVGRGGERILEASEGSLGPDDPISVASASKWMSAALIMTVVDEGRLSLDTTVSDLFPEADGPVAEVTLKQLLSFTAGQGGLLGSPDLRPADGGDLQQDALEILRRPLRDPPGTVFRYGGPSLQLAGAMAERATGSSWADMFDARLAQPLGLEHSWWTASPRSAGVPRSHARRPNLQAGLVTTAADYMRFLEMVAGDGGFRGRRILSRETVGAMTAVQTGAAATTALGPGIDRDGLAYALGAWCEARDPSNRCLVVSSPGAWGAYPWIDRDTKIYGLIFVEDRLPRIRADLLELRRLARDAAAQAPR